MSDLAQAPPQPSLLTAQGIRKTYGGIRALRGVDFEVRAGEVHGLVGENGAGKSTLIKCLAGAETPDEGSICVSDTVLALGDPQASLAAGISTVYQEPSLFGELTVAENVFVGRERTVHGRVDWPTQMRLARELLTDIGLDPGLADRTLADLSIGQQQLVSVAKAFATRVKILILDEPSAILTDKEIETLFRVVRRVRDAGTGVIYISHRLDELGKITDRVTVMRDGSIVTTRDTRSLSTREIAELMVGRELDGVQSANSSVGPVVMSVRDLAAGRALRGVSFDLHADEVLGVYGLVGSGTAELARALYGIEPARAGTIEVRGRQVQLRTPAAARRAGIMLTPGNRKSEGVFLNKSLAFNVSAHHLKHFSPRLGVMDARRETSTTADLMQQLRIKAPAPATRIGSLSGGNQQKVVIARQLVRQAVVNILEEPTQGVDVGAQNEIHRLVLDLVRAGTACLLISSDLEEVRRLSDRVVVLHGGRIAAVLGRGARAADLLAAASGDRGTHTEGSSQ